MNGYAETSGGKMNLKERIKLIPRFLIKFWMPVLGVFLVLLIFSLGYVGKGLIGTETQEVKGQGVEDVDSEELEQESELKEETIEQKEQKDYSNYKFLKNLQPGDEGEDVLALQYKLGIEMTGVYDDNTFNAVVRYQVKNKILPSVDSYGAGYFGPKTRNFINSGKLADADDNDRNNKSILPESNNRQLTSNPAPEVKHYVDLSINWGNAAGGYQVEIQGNETVFSILLKASQQNSFTFLYTDWGDMGIFIDQIGNLKNSDDWSNYWQYWINGQYAQVSCSAQPVSNGDFIEWKYASSPW